MHVVPELGVLGARQDPCRDPESLEISDEATARRQARAEMEARAKADIGPRAASGPHWSPEGKL